MVRIGVLCLEDLVKDPKEMYNELCAVDGVGHDPCVRDVFAAAVAYANGDRPDRGGPSRPKEKPVIETRGERDKVRAHDLLPEGRRRGRLIPDQLTG